MPVNNIVLMTFGSWESTDLLNNQVEVSASRLFLQIICDSAIGGIKAGSSMEHYVAPFDDASQAAPEQLPRFPLFPGRFEADLNVPTGLTDSNGQPTYTRNLVVVENTHPTVNQDFTRIWLNNGDGSVTDDDEVTDTVLEFYLELDYPKNIVNSYIRIYKKPLLGGDSEIAITLL